MTDKKIVALTGKRVKWWAMYRNLKERIDIKFYEMCSKMSAYIPLCAFRHMWVVKEYR